MCLPVKPYKVEREWKAFGLSCAVVLSREAAHRCGYVRVPPGYSTHGVSYESVEVSVHGGLTFTELEPCQEHSDGQGWWLGFDCAHSGDAMYDPNAVIADLQSDEAKKSLAIHRSMDCYRQRMPAEHYWTQSEVEQETERLAEQLAAIKEAP